MEQRLVCVAVLNKERRTVVTYAPCSLNPFFTDMNTP